MEMRLHYAAATLLRLALIGWGALQDAMCEVKYTDVDYGVFTDAARLVSEGRSPFARHTYRYTPLLAWLLVPNVLVHAAFGKALFALLDIAAGRAVYHVQLSSGHTPSVSKVCALLWLYNPLPAVLSTRGSAEALVTLLVLAASLQRRPSLAGAALGLAAHVRIYPVIYFPTLYFATAPAEWKKSPPTAWSLLRPTRERLSFAASAAVGFLTPTLASAFLYGEEYVREALLHHVTRRDVRHNFSPFFYLLYLTDGGAVVSYVGFALQAGLIALASFVYAPSSTPHCAMLVHTLLFVSLNKVCTSQYFAWYLCFLPLAWPRLRGGGAGGLAAVLWAAGQGLWLHFAHALEFKGQNAFFSVFLASMVFFGVNVGLVGWIVKRGKSALKMD